MKRVDYHQLRELRRATELPVTQCRDLLWETDGDYKEALSIAQGGKVYVGEIQSNTNHLLCITTNSFGVIRGGTALTQEM